MRLGDVLKDRFGVAPQLIAGRGGVFDVVVDGKLIFSKHDTGRFPDEDQVIALIAGTP